MTTTVITEGLLRDRAEISEMPARMAWGLDHCEWSGMVELFTEEVRVDYTSLNGGEPMMVPRKDLIEKWRGNREGLAATQHMVSNQLVDVTGDTAVVTAMFQATHVLPNPYGGPTWTLGGRYTYGLIRQPEGWRINSITMNIMWAEGNRHIRDLALESR
jgi:SnoaL-like domain